MNSAGELNSHLLPCTSLVLISPTTGGSASSNAHSSKRTVLTSRTPRIRFLPGGSDIDSTVLHSPGGERKKSRRRRGQNHAWLGGNRRVVGLLLVGLSLVLWWVGKGRLWGRPPLRIRELVSWSLCGCGPEADGQVVQLQDHIPFNHTFTSTFLNRSVYDQQHAFSTSRKSLDQPPWED